MQQVQVRSNSRGRLGFKLGLLFVAVGLLTACGDCSDETAAAERFIDKAENRTCQTDADCTVVDTGCNDVSRGLCGQAPLSRAAVATEAWQKLSHDLQDCDDGHCLRCDALLLPSCTTGLCGGP
jgi:hypothetical protein